MVDMRLPPKYETGVTEFISKLNDNIDFIVIDEREL